MFATLSVGGGLTMIGHRTLHTLLSAAWYQVEPHLEPYAQCVLVCVSVCVCEGDFGKASMSGGSALTERLCC